MTKKQLLGKLEKLFGYTEFRTFQYEAIDKLIYNHSCALIIPTGSGKSLPYQFSSLLRPGTAIVISPLISLMKDQVDGFNSKVNPKDVDGFSGDEVSCYINSTQSKSEQDECIHKMINGQYKLVYMAPETLDRQEIQDYLKQTDISFFAVDEAHCVSTWGHDFRVKYRKIPEMLKEIGNYPVIALTATATLKTQQDILNHFDIPMSNCFRSPYSRPNLTYKVVDKTKVDVDENIVRYIKNRDGQSGIIYCTTRKNTEEIALTLRCNGINAEAYHAGMSVKRRAEVQEEFINDKIDIVVATIAFGQGFDKPDIRFILHYCLSQSPEAYLQESGRGGRDGEPCDCILFFSQRDVAKLVWLMKQIKSKAYNPVKLLYEFVDMIKLALRKDVFRYELIKYIDG